MFEDENLSAFLNEYEQGNKKTRIQGVIFDSV